MTTHVLRDLMHAPPRGGEREDFARCESLRRELARGAISGVDRTLAAQSVRASSPPARCALLYRLVVSLRPHRVVEFGSGMGVSGAYLASALKTTGCGRLTTIEASPVRQPVVRHVVDAAARGVTDFIAGSFDDNLAVLDTAALFFLDGNHLADPTINYLREARHRMISASAIVLDDIAGYSVEMDDAWARVQQEPGFDVIDSFAGVGLLMRGDAAMATYRSMSGPHAALRVAAMRARFVLFRMLRH